MGRRQFGSVRRRSSGRWEASYWHGGARHLAPATFTTKADAGAWLSSVETAVRTGAWVDPRLGRISFGQYAELWLAARTDLRPRSVEQYRGILDRHLLPAFGAIELARVRPVDVRAWFAQLSVARPATATNAYRLLRAIFNTAVRDEYVAANPCRIVGAGSDRTPERPLLTRPHVEALTSAMPAELRAAVVLAAWGGLRRGEVLGIQRRDVNEVVGRVRVDRTLHEMHDGTVVLGPPKSKAGRRSVHLPRPAMAAISDHLRSAVGPEPTAPLFTGTNGRPLRPRTLESAWRRARSHAGVPWARFHDLRHFHLTLFATMGATTAELMARAGHSSAKAALTYQHATEDRDRVLADILGRVMEPEAAGSEVPDDRSTDRPVAAQQLGIASP